MRRAVVAIGVVLVVLVAVVVARTLAHAPHAPGSRAENTGETLPQISVDTDAAASRLARGLTFETISLGEGVPVDPEAFRAFQQHLAESYPLVHAQLARETIAGHSLLFTWQGSDPALEPAMLMAHQDVVPVDQASWKQPPFGGRIVDGELWGRGAIDDKGALFSIFEAVELLLADGWKPTRTLYLFFGHDEEVGGTGAAAAASQLAARGVRLAWVLDEGGLVVQGMIPGIEVPVALVGVAEKGFVTLQLDLETEGGHSSLPPRHTGIGIMSQAVNRLELNPMPGGIDGTTRDFLEALAPELPLAFRAVLSNLWLTGSLVEAIMDGNPALDAMQRTTTAVTMIDGGVKSNVLPSHVRATVNFRVRPGDTVEQVREHVRETIDDERIALTLETGTEASQISPVDSESYALIARTIGEIFPEAGVVPYVVVGGTDARNFYSVTPNVFRFNPFRFGPETVTLAHGTDERVPVAQLPDAIRFYVRLIRNANGGG